MLRGVNDGFADDPDDDGRPNIAEFALDGEPLSGERDGKQRAWIEPVAGTDYFTYTFPVRSGAGFAQSGELSATVDDLVYSVAGALDLSVFDQRLVEDVPASKTGLPVPDPGWSYRTFRLDRAILYKT